MKCFTTTTLHTEKYYSFNPLFTFRNGKNITQSLPRSVKMVPDDVEQVAAQSSLHTQESLFLQPSLYIHYVPWQETPLGETRGISVLL